MVKNDHDLGITNDDYCDFLSVSVKREKKNKHV